LSRWDHGPKWCFDGSTIHPDHSLVEHQVIEPVRRAILVCLKT
jgi:hypothetical protein